MVTVIQLLIATMLLLLSLMFAELWATYIFSYPTGSAVNKVRDDIGNCRDGYFNCQAATAAYLKVRQGWQGSISEASASTRANDGLRRKRFWRKIRLVRDQILLTTQQAENTMIFWLEKWFTTLKSTNTKTFQESIIQLNFVRKNEQFEVWGGKKHRNAENSVVVIALAPLLPFFTVCVNKKKCKIETLQKDASSTVKRRTDTHS